MIRTRFAEGLTHWQTDRNVDVHVHKVYSFCLMDNGPGQRRQMLSSKATDVTVQNSVYPLHMPPWLWQCWSFARVLRVKHGGRNPRTDTALAFPYASRVRCRIHRRGIRLFLCASRPPSSGFLPLLLVFFSCSSRRFFSATRWRDGSTNALVRLYTNCDMLLASYAGCQAFSRLDCRTQVLSTHRRSMHAHLFEQRHIQDFSVQRPTSLTHPEWIVDLILNLAYPCSRSPLPCSPAPPALTRTYTGLF